MKKMQIFVLLFLIISIIAITGCTTKPPDEIMGKWTQQMKYVDSEHYSHTIRGSPTTLYFNDGGILIVEDSVLGSKIQAETEYKFIDKSHFKVIFDGEEDVYEIVKLNERELLFILDGLDAKEDEDNIQRYER